ncbi:MAG: PDZ domain-containing protein [Gemmatimonadetes bacterium]|nr:PDZ domain-containing protein [Gemmatimonadota bacterium]NIQ58421.1 PDZ domain-containing protein [Gemmatimonadota bacterium]NIU78634.1 PDZ domain-containing protein [Gammaproteobacteria bacterium]NIX47475.1 PDZ domain-containing protein [Gemmatimonadota bacterium]NIY11856.1 PDZ domain-containing protein [Gemmatimonadota bacterium]
MRTANPFVTRYTLVALAAALLPAGLTAQEPEERDRDCVCLRELAEAGPGWAFQRSRARIGVMLDEETEVDGRSGAVVHEVTADGPADRAGIRAGDVIVALDGRDLGEDPVQGIMTAMRDVEPGDTVRVTYLRDGGERTVGIETEEAEALAWSFGRAAPGGDFHFEGPRVRGIAANPQLRIVDALHLRGELELVAVNPRLGRYFGVEEGVLVADVAEDSDLGLRPGDVIVAIDGRAVRDPAHARAILRSYRADEELTFRIVRDRRESDVTGTSR